MMTRRTIIFGIGVTAIVLASLGAFVYSQSVPYMSGDIVAIPPRGRKVPNKYCKMVFRPPEKINMCLYRDHTFCGNWCVKVTESGKYCDERLHFTCNSLQQEKRVKIESAHCFPMLSRCKCGDEWDEREITVVWMTCEPEFAVAPQ
jgi:hypothetical protein